MSFKRLFARSLAADPERLHCAAHSHHLWPDASHDGHLEAWAVAARRADTKWDEIMGPVWAEAQGHVTNELRLPDPATIAFAPNTHDFLVRIVSALPDRPLRVLATDGEFHSFRRQIARWTEDGRIIPTIIAAEPFDSLDARLLAAARSGRHDLIFVSHVQFATGAIVGVLGELAALAAPDGPWLVIDGYHGFMGIETDLSAIADRAFYLSGGYKYAMAGEGVSFLHAPPGFGMRPRVTGWYAEFDQLTAAPGTVGYHSDARRFLGATFDPSGLYRFNAVRRMLESEALSTQRISDHVARLQHRFVNRADMPGLTLLNPLTDAPHARFLAYRGAAARGLYAALGDRNIITDLRGDILRIGFGLYHDETDVDRMAETLSTLTAAQGA